jgi:hypothetical protein
VRNPEAHAGVSSLQVKLLVWISPILILPAALATATRSVPLGARYKPTFLFVLAPLAGLFVCC